MKILSSNAAMIAYTLTSLVSMMVAFLRGRRLRRAIAHLEKRYGVEMQEFSRDLDTVSRKAGEHSRRIVWLETRLRPRPQEEKEELVPAQVANVKPTITERRHRVLTLARRGKDPRSIAQTLGMPHGEVELMLNLHAA